MQKKSPKKSSPSPTQTAGTIGTHTAATEILKTLNDQQSLAVQTTTGPVLILAGAGSGKTKTLVHRIAYLIAHENVKPWSILAVTFTNKAARNMKERMETLIGQMEHPPVMGTFHSVCSRILRREIEAIGFEKNFTIYDSDDQLTLVKKIMKDLGYDTKQVAPSLVHWQISKAKNELKTPAQVEAETGDALSEVVARVYPKYQSELQAHNALDFDDMIMKTVELLKQYPEVLKKYQTLWEYILVDEYQDTNQAQYQLVTMLAAAHKNICVVGDDAQSIYSWRQADIRNILEFEKDYPDATEIFLEQNYRSTQTILDASNAIIANNPKQKKKKLWTENPGGDSIIVRELEDGDAEGKYIVEVIAGKIKEHAGNGTDGSDDEVTYDDEYAQPDPDEIDQSPINAGESILDRIMGSKMFNQHKETEELSAYIKANKASIDFAKYVVLYRTNAQSRPLEEAFLKYGIPYQLVGGLRFYDRREIRDLLAYMKVLFNPSDWVAMERIVNVPARGIGDRTWFKIEQFARQRNFTVIDAAKNDIPDVQAARIGKFYQFAGELEHIRNQMEALNPTEILELLTKEISFKEHLEKTSETKEEAEMRWENVQELKNVTQKFMSLRGTEGLLAFLEDVALVSDQDSIDENEKAVKLMTVHAAKGLEFPVVFVTGMEEGLFPHSRSLVDPQEMEEERRLCYVALTRAEHQAYFLFASKRMKYGEMHVNPPSRFLDEIPKELVVWKSPWN